MTFFRGMNGINGKHDTSIYKRIMTDVVLFLKPAAAL